MEYPHMMMRNVKHLTYTWMLIYLTNRPMVYAYVDCCLSDNPQWPYKNDRCAICLKVPDEAVESPRRMRASRVLGEKAIEIRIPDLSL